MKKKFRSAALGVFSAMLIFNTAFSSVAFANEEFSAATEMTTLSQDDAETAGSTGSGLSDGVVKKGDAASVKDDAGSSDNLQNPSGDSSGSGAYAGGDDDASTDGDGASKENGAGTSAGDGESAAEDVPSGDDAAAAGGSRSGSEKESEDAENGETEGTSDPETEADTEADPDMESDTEAETVDALTRGSLEEAQETDAEDLLSASATSGSCGENATWNYNSATGVLTISGSGRMDDYDIEITTNDKATTTAPWFQYASGIKELKISDDITYIGKAAFAALKPQVAGFSLPSALTELGSYAFFYCQFNAAVTLDIPGSVKVIPEYCFYRTHGPEGKLIFNEGTTTIGAHAFESCSIKVEQWADSITTVGESGFDYSSGTVDYVIPKGIKKIGKRGFYHIQHIRSITFKGNMPQMEEEAFARNSVIAYYDPDNSTFSKAARDKASQYFEDVTWRPIGYKVSDKAGEKITWRYDEATDALYFEGEGAMYDYSSSNLPDWFTCSRSVERFYFDPRITTIGDYAFYHFGDFRYGIEHNGTIALPAKLKKIGKCAFSGDAFYNVTMPQEVEIIDDGAFSGMQCLCSFTFPKGVKWIGDNAFNATMFKDAEIDLSSIEHIGSYGLYLSSESKNVTASYEFPNTLKYIGDNAFGYKVVPKSSRLTLPEGLEYLGASAFHSTVLTGEVAYPSTVTKVNKYVFGSTGIESVVFENTLTDVDENAFNETIYKLMSSLKKLTFKGSFPNLKKNVFAYAKSKLTVYYPFDDETWLPGIASLYYDSTMVEFVPVGGSATVTFIADGAVVKTQTVASGGKVSAPSVTTLKNGQEIGGWYTSSTVQYEGTKWNFNDTVKHRMTLYAGAKYEGHRVVFFPLNGKAPLVKTVKDGANLDGDKDVKALETYSGYRFLGWYSTKNYEYGTKVDLSKPIASEMALYAYWTVFRPIVTYDNSRYAFVPDWTESYEIGETFSQEEYSIEYYTKDGYAKFLGWYKDAGFKTKVPANMKVTADMTVYGKWEIVKHKVTFYYGDERAPLVIEVEHCGNVALPADPARTGFRFLGWSKEEGSTETEWTGPYNVKEDLEYYAVWEAKQLTLCYIIKIPNLAAETKYKYQLAGEGFVDYFDSFTNTNLQYYDFAGWFYDAQFTKPIAIGTPLYENADIYGKLVPKTYTVTVDPDNGEEPYILQVEYNTRPVVDIPVRKGYEFDGWDDITDGTQVSWGPTFRKITRDTKVRASWTKEAYTQKIVISGVIDRTYTGAAVTLPDLKITDGTYTLENGRDYTLKYRNNVNVGEAYVDVIYKGRYSGKTSLSFDIEKADFKKLKESGSISSSFEKTYLAYNGKTQKAVPKITCTASGKAVTLKANKDYKLVYVGTDSSVGDYNPEAFKEAGSYTIKVVGTGNFSGELTLTQVITQDKLAGKLAVTGLKKSYAYTGDSILPEFEVKDGKTLVGKFVEGSFNSDVLRCEITENKEIGKARILITAIDGKGYAGSKTATFTIVGTPLSKAAFDGFKSSFGYDGGKEIKQDVRIYRTAAARKAQDDSALLKENVDYTVDYLNNTDVGKATVIYTGMGAYSGVVKKTFTIKGKSIKKAGISGIANSSFTGTEVEQAGLVVTDPVTGAALSGIEAASYDKLSDDDKRAYDYVLTYQNNRNIGTAKVTVKGVNGYTGKVTKSFKIKAVDLSAQLTSDATIGKLTCSDSANYAKKGCRPDYISVTATVNGKSVTLYEDLDYTVSCTGTGKVGNTAQLIVKGKGNYTGKLVKTFTVKDGLWEDILITVPAYRNKKGNFVCSITVYDRKWNKLTKGTDYKVVYKSISKELSPSRDKLEKGDRLEIVVEGMGMYKGRHSAYYYLTDAIQKSSGTYNPVKSLSSCSVSLRDYIYTGKEIKPDQDNIVIRYKGADIGSSNYHIIGYENNTEVGTATVILEGLNYYKGIYKLKFKITPRAVEEESTSIK